MELTIKGTPEEIKKLLTIDGSEKQSELLKIVKQIREDHRPFTHKELQKIRNRY
ncbi:hypothetical protein ACA593_10310 [Lactiplantibacillus pentosus]|uniref:hypothetical protein n=1 Tax=Lactiplantibacillus pentosus TaxID=1589 RepID=UPI00130514C6|nr:hypothetical protein [Lactiplantibacillus pentosus]MBO9163976.1 hypothetical protein [Lactiplantibacillus pentosus]